MGISRTFSIHFWLHLAKQKGDLAPVYARITVNGKRAEISLKRTTSVTYWDTKSKRTTLRSINGKELNTYLDEVQAKLLACHKDLVANFELITAHSLKAYYLGLHESHKTLLELISYHNQNTVGTLKPGTLKNYYTTEKYLKHFLLSKLKVGDMYLKHIKYPFIIDFEQYLRNGPWLQEYRPLSNNGVMKHIERLNKLMNFALDLEWLDKNPFVRYKSKFIKKERAFLLKHELEKLQKAQIENEGYRVVRDVFIFSCYTGLDYSNVKGLKSQHIVRGIDGKFWINMQRDKSGVMARIPILDEALTILELYREYPIKGDNLLPVISNQKMNAYLKEIMTLCQIEKHITFHSARHTFATTVTLSNGVPISTVSKLMGHTKISTTQIYARVLEDKISADMNNLRGVLKNNNSDGLPKISGW